MIKMLTALEGEGLSVAAGQTTDKLSAAEEKRYIEAGLAEAVKSEPKAKAKSKK